MLVSSSTVILTGDALEALDKIQRRSERAPLVVGQMGVHQRMRHRIVGGALRDGQGIEILLGSVVPPGALVVDISKRSEERLWFLLEVGVSASPGVDVLGRIGDHLARPAVVDPYDAERVWLPRKKTVTSCWARSSAPIRAA